ncbi:hypothetical protein LY90DRAFT_299841, partial [Neocallimastix californiae]
CCSEYGYCDDSPAHCGYGCQVGYGICDIIPTINKNPISTDGRCGKEFGTVCGDNLCCSEYGYCDDSPAHCGYGCQVGYGICDIIPTINKNPISTDGRCGKEFGTVCGDNLCCSKYGYCDDSPAHCGYGCQIGYVIPTINKNPISTDGRCGKEFGTVCGDNLCCSEYGYCDDSPAHCGYGCQVGYGICDS